MGTTLTPNQVIQARASAGNMSQSALATGARLNRNILSAFEQGRLVLGDELTERIRAFFDAHGVNLSDSSVGAPEPDTQVQAHSSNNETGLRHVDRFQVPASLTEDEIEDRLDELFRTEAEIRSLLTTPNEPGWFSPDEQFETAKPKLFANLAAWHFQVLSLQGWSVPIPAEQIDADTPANLAEWLEGFMAEQLTPIADNEAISQSKGGFTASA